MNRRGFFGAIAGAAVAAKVPVVEAAVTLDAQHTERPVEKWGKGGKWHRYCCATFPKGTYSPISPYDDWDESRCDCGFNEKWTA